MGTTIRAVFSHYDPFFSSCSLDEASLDITDYLSKRNQGLSENDLHRVTGKTVAAEIRARIFEATSLTASAGIAANRMLGPPNKLTLHSHHWSKFPKCTQIMSPNNKYAEMCSENCLREE